LYQEKPTELQHEIFPNYGKVALNTNTFTVLDQEMLDILAIKFHYWSVKRIAYGLLHFKHFN